MREQESQRNYRQRARRVTASTCLSVAGLIVIAAQAGCSLWQENVTAERRESANQVEPLLEQAGFLRMAAETSAQRTELNSLKPLTISRSLDTKHGMRYWYADPYVCGCMYAGNEAAYDRYREIRGTAQATAQMKASNVLNQEEWDQVSDAPEINMFNPVFSP
jgi:hypothetical protein